jgi:hypothetical protein
MEDETQGSSSEPKEIAKGSQVSSESKEASQALPAEEIEEKLHRERMARGEEVFERSRAKLIANGDWASLSATFDRAASAPGAYQRIVSDKLKEAIIGRNEFLSECAQKRSEAKAAMGANSKASEDAAKEPSPLLTHVRDKFKKASLRQCHAYRLISD